MMLAELKAVEPESISPQLLGLYHLLSWAFARTPDLGQTKKKHHTHVLISIWIWPQTRVHLAMYTVDLPYINLNVVTRIVLLMVICLTTRKIKETRKKKFKKSQQKPKKKKRFIQLFIPHRTALHHSKGGGVISLKHGKTGAHHGLRMFKMWPQIFWSKNWWLEKFFCLDSLVWSSWPKPFHIPEK